MKNDFNFDLDLILKMVNEEGKMLKEVIEYYGCSRGQMGSFLRKNNLNFRNNPNARKNQSKLMCGEMNPTKGKKRKNSEMQGVKEAHKKRADVYWDELFKNGMTYEQYAKSCRQIIPREFKEKTTKFITEVDHIFSIKDCWDNGIHPRYASNINNLRIVSANENKLKGKKSLITLNEFLSIVGVQRLSKAQFKYWKQVE